MFILDTRTVVSVMVVACVLMGGGLLAVSRMYRKDVPEAGWWAWGMLLQGAGWLVFGSLRGALPDVPSIVVGQLLLQLSVAMCLVALENFLRLPRRLGWVAGVLVLNTAALFFFSGVMPSYPDRQIVIALTRAVFAFWSAGILWRVAPRPRIHEFTAALFAVCGALLVGRAAVFVALRDRASQVPLESHPLTQVTFLGYFAFAVALPFCFVLMCNERHLEQRSRAEGELRAAAAIDQLTRLANRATVTDHLRGLIERQGRRADDLFAVLFVDLDNFKFVNDSLGHEAGDRLLIATAARLTSTLRQGEMASHSLAGRFGGDEFVLVLSGLRQASDAESVAQRVLQAMAKPFELMGQSLSVRCSIGVCTSAHGATLIEDILRDADTAMYHAKSAGKATYVVFDEEMRRRAEARLRLESELREAVAAERVAVVYQPVIDLGTGRVRGFEAQPEWRGQERQITRDEYLALTEEAGLSAAVGECLLRQVEADLSALQDDRSRAITVIVPITRRQLASAGFRATAERVATQPAVKGRLSFAIPENAVASETEPVRAAFQHLRRVGAEIHLDDFGTGLASLTLARTLAIDGLKIDGRFLATAQTDVQTMTILNSMVMLGRTLGKAVTVCGVSEPRQMATLLGLECDAAQGPLFGEARGVQELRALYDKRFDALCSAA